MAKVTPILRTQKKDSRGRCPIWLRISDRSTTRFLSLGEKVLPSQWNDRQGRVRKGHKHADLLNRLIEKKVDQAREEILLRKLEDEYATADHIKETLQPDRQDEVDFLVYWQQHLDELEQRGKIGRLRRLRSTVKKVHSFAAGRGLLPLTFSALTVRFLRDFETYCLTELGNKQSTVGTNLSDIRALINRAVDERLLEHGDNPFLRFSIKQGAKPERTKLSFEEVRALERLELEEHSPLWHTRNVFLFAFYAAGIRFSDVAMMTAGRIVTGTADEPDRLIYRMGKTGKQQSVKITPPACHILNHYLTPDKTEDDFIFPLLEGYELSTPKQIYNAKGSQNTLCNKHLKQLAEMVGLDKDISMHVARHSFADAARTAGWSIYDISKALQHASVSITENYLKAFDSNALDERMAALFSASTMNQ